MRKAITAKEWGNEIEYRFKKYLAFLFAENDLAISCNARVSLIYIHLKTKEDLENNKELAKQIRSALAMATRDCPYEYQVIYD